MKSTVIYLQAFFFLFVLNLSHPLKAQCVISNITVETFGCESGDTFFSEINFDYSGDVGEDFTYSISGQQDGVYPYDALPLYLDVIDVPDFDFLTITISDDTGTGCSNVSEFENPCFEECFIYNLTAIPGDCNGQDQFELTVDFEHEFTSDFFDLHINIGNGVVIPNIPYTDLPYTATGLSEQCTADILISIFDSEDDGCVHSMLTSPVCCSFDLCDLSNLVVDVNDCDGTEFGASVNFDFIGTSDEFDYIVYDDFGVEVETGTYFYSNLPLDLSFDNTSDSGFKVVISDQDDITCNIFQDFDNPCYQECLIYDLTAVPVTCTDGEFIIVVDFEHEFTSGFFDLHITYPFGVLIESIPYTSVPYTVTGLQEDCDSEIEVLVCDAEIDSCLDVIDLDPICCADFCVFSNLAIDISECDGSEYSVDIDLDYVGNATVFDYVLYDDQSWPVQTGSYEYVDLPLVLFVDNTSSIVNYIVINDQDDQDCIIEGYFDNPCYNQVGDCNITGIDFNDIPVCDEGLIIADWFIFSENTNQVGFDIFINDEFQFFIAYEGDGLYSFDLEVPDTNSPLDEVFLLTICDNDDPDCCFSIDVENPCYNEMPECDLAELIIENTDCVDGQFDLIIGLEYTGDVNDLYEYNVVDDQNEIVVEGTAEIAQLPLVVSISNSDSEWFLIEVNESDSPDCIIINELFNPCYNIQSCTIEDMVVTVGECDDAGEFSVTIDFNYSNTGSQFTIVGNGTDYGLFSYTDLPVTIGGLSSDNELVYEFIIQDQNNTACTDFVEVGPICCKTELCNIFSIDFGENPICDDGFIEAEWSIFSENTSEVGFDIFINDEFVAFLDFIGEGPYDIDIEDTVTENFTITVCDNDNPDCCYSWELENPCFDATECVFSNLEIETTECDNGEFDLIVNFEYEGVTNDFYDYIIYDQVNDVVSEGILPFGQLPLIVTIEDVNSEFFVISLFENDNDECLIIGDLDNPCFDDTAICQMTTLDFGQNPICENGFINTEWLIDGENTSNVGYDIFINGIFELFVDYEGDNLYDFDIAAPDSEFFTITVCDNDNADCCIDWELENPCYIPTVSNCMIDDLEATIITCEGAGFDVMIDFEYNDTGDQFTINGNGNSYGTFNYTDLPITLTGLDADCTTEFEFAIEDLEDGDCNAVIDYGTVCCEDFNIIVETTVNYIIAEDVINMSIDLTTALLDGCTIDVYINDELYVVLTNESTSFDLGPYDCGTDEILALKLINTCTEEITDLNIDLGDIECVTHNENTDISDLLVWNQNQKQLIIKSDNRRILGLVILSSDGRVVSQNESISNARVVDLTHIVTGIYFVRIVDEENGSIGVKKMFVH